MNNNKQTWGVYLLVMAPSLLCHWQHLAVANCRLAVTHCRFQEPLVVAARTCCANTVTMLFTLVTWLCSLQVSLRTRRDNRKRFQLQGQRVARAFVSWPQRAQVILCCCTCRCTAVTSKSSHSGSAASVQVVHASSSHQSLNRTTGHQSERQQVGVALAPPAVVWCTSPRAITGNPAHHLGAPHRHVKS